MKTLSLETTMPFQGLPELVAYDEGLFEKEGIAINWVDRGYANVKIADTSLTDVKGANLFASHGTLLEAGKADMYNACEWGNYCRVGGTAVGAISTRSRPKSCALRRAAAVGITSAVPSGNTARTSRARIDSFTFSLRFCLRGGKFLPGYMFRV